MVEKSIRHKFVSSKPDGSDPSLARASDWNADHNFSLGINAQTGTTYTVSENDAWCLVTYNNASPVAVIIPQAGFGNQFLAGHVSFHRNIGAGTVTVTPIVSTID